MMDVSDKAPPRVVERKDAGDTPEREAITQRFSDEELLVLRTLVTPRPQQREPEPPPAAPPVTGPQPPHEPEGEAPRRPDAPREDYPGSTTPTRRIRRFEG